MPTLTKDMELGRLRYLHEETVRLRRVTKRYRKLRTRDSYRAMRDQEKLMDELLDNLSGDAWQPGNSKTTY